MYTIKKVMWRLKLVITKKGLMEHDTRKEMEQEVAVCRALFEKKTRDYGTSWRILRLGCDVSPETVFVAFYLPAND